MNCTRGTLIIGALAALHCSKPAPKDTAVPAAANVPASSNGTLFKWDRPTSLVGTNLPITQSATCRFKKGLAVNFNKIITNEEPNAPERVYYDLSGEDELDPVTFVDLDTRAPKVRSNGGQATLVVAYDDGHRLTLINNKPDGAEMYSVFRDKGVVIYTQQKNSSFIGPFGVMEMGYCN